VLNDQRWIVRSDQLWVMNMTNQEQATGEGDALRTLRATDNPECVAGRTDTQPKSRLTSRSAKVRAGDAHNFKMEVGWRGTGGRSQDRISLEWDDRELNHYHIWLTTEERMDDMSGPHFFLGGRWYVAKNVIFVNPPAGTDSSDPRYFKTKMWNAMAAVNEDMLRKAWRHTDIDGAYAAFDQRQELEARQRDHNRRAIMLTVSNARGDETLSMDIRDFDLEQWDSLPNMELLKKIQHAVAVVIGLNAKK
jgi:hypothetical protein